jgi:voltage-gated potassium channel
VAGRYQRMNVTRRFMTIAAGTLQRGLVLGAILSAILLVGCAVLFFVVEHARGNPNVPDMWAAFGWVTQTLLQGEPAFEVLTGVGKFLFYVVVVTGVGLVAIATGAVATKLIEIIRRRDMGMGESDDSGHIVICGWSPKGAEILKELHADEVKDKRPIVILANLETNPTGDPLATFIRGNPSNAVDLHRAAIERADTAIILADDTNPNLEADDIDAKTLLCALAVESINPNVHTCVEVIKSENRQHFERAKADELVVSAELTGALLASAAIHHGITAAVTDLLTHPGGTEFYRIDPPDDLLGATFGTALERLKADQNCIVVAIARGETSYDINPPSDQKIRPGDRLLVIAESDPSAR